MTILPCKTRTALAAVAATANAAVTAVVAASCTDTMAGTGVVACMGFVVVVVVRAIFRLLSNLLRSPHRHVLDTDFEIIVDRPPNEPCVATSITSTITILLLFFELINIIDIPCWPCRANGEVGLRTPELQQYVHEGVSVGVLKGTAGIIYC